MGYSKYKITLMQKVVTVTIDLERLQEAGQQQENAREASFVSEIPEINQLLEEGWIIEEWENLSVNSVNGSVTLLFILADELYDMTEGAADNELQLEEEEE